MEYFYRSKELWDIFNRVQNEMTRANHDENPLRQLVNDTIIGTVTRIKAEISYYGFQGLLVSEEEVWEHVQDRNVEKMLDDMADAAEKGRGLVPTPPAVVKEIGPLTDAFRKGLEGEE